MSLAGPEPGLLGCPGESGLLGPGGSRLLGLGGSGLLGAGRSGLLGLGGSSDEMDWRAVNC